MVARIKHETGFDLFSILKVTEVSLSIDGRQLLVVLSYFNGRYLSVCGVEMFFVVRLLLEF